MIAEPLESGLAEDIENEKVSITWNKYVIVDLYLSSMKTFTFVLSFAFLSEILKMFNPKRNFKNKILCNLKIYILFN